MTNDRSIALCLPIVFALTLLACTETGDSPTLPDAEVTVDAAPEVDAGADRLGYVARSEWLVRGEAPSAAICDADRIARVRLRVLDAEAVILDELVAPCSDGAFAGTTVLPWGVRHYGVWTALAPDGEELQHIPVSMPIAAAMPRTTLDVTAASFEVRPPEWHDYAAGGVATITGYPDPAACAMAGITELRLVLTPTDGGEPVRGAEQCGDGRIFVRTEPLLDYGREYAVKWEAIAGDGSVVNVAEIAPVRMIAPTRALFGLDARF